MWIRSQNKNDLIKIEEIWTKHEKVYANNSMFLGGYLTAYKCLEILDEIQLAIACKKKLFQMPEE